MEKTKTTDTTKPTDTTDTTNIIPDVRKPGIFYPMIALLIALIISLYVFYKDFLTSLGIG
jgi:hypothetical protein